MRASMIRAHALRGNCRCCKAVGFERDSSLLWPFAARNRPEGRFFSRVIRAAVLLGEMRRLPPSSGRLCCRGSLRRLRRFVLHGRAAAADAHAGDAPVFAADADTDAGRLCVLFFHGFSPVVSGFGLVRREARFFRPPLLRWAYLGVVYNSFWMWLLRGFVRFQDIKL